MDDPTTIARLRESFNFLSAVARPHGSVLGKPADTNFASRRFHMRQRTDYPTFSDQEIERRHQAIYNLMEQEGVDAALIYGSGRYASDIYWLSDWPGSRQASLLIQSGKEPGIVMKL